MKSHQEVCREKTAILLVVVINAASLHSSCWLDFIDEIIITAAAGLTGVSQEWKWVLPAAHRSVWASTWLSNGEGGERRMKKQKLLLLSLWRKTERKRKEKKLLDPMTVRSSRSYNDRPPWSLPVCVVGTLFWFQSSGDVCNDLFSGVARSTADT